jgi:type I site-specific restriction endonuclease
VIPSESNSERLTRKRLIDPKLKAAGWKIVPFSTQKSLIHDGPCAIEEFETANGPSERRMAHFRRAETVDDNETRTVKR